MAAVKYLYWNKFACDQYIFDCCGITEICIARDNNVIINYGLTFRYSNFSWQQNQNSRHKMTGYFQHIDPVYMLMIS